MGSKLKQGKNMTDKEFHLAWDLNEAMQKHRIFKEEIRDLLLDAVDAAEIDAIPICIERIKTVICRTEEN
jgi:hypothetical protein